MGDFRLVFVLAGLVLSLPAQALSLQGKTDFAERIQINAATAGIVRKIAVKPGQAVRSGELLLELDDTSHKARLNQAKGLQQSLLPAVTTAELEFERAEELYDRDSLSQVELTLAESRLLKAQGDYQAAAAEVERYAFALSQTQIKAPAAARVVSVSTNEGLFINPDVTNDPLLTLVSATRMTAIVLIDAREWKPALLDKKARVTMQRQTFSGVVDYLGLEPSTTGGDEPAYELRVSFDSSGLLAAGLPVTVEIMD